MFIPIVLLGIGFMIAVVGVTVWFLFHAAGQATQVVNNCRKCGYDLRRLEKTRRCPECGTPFTVNDKGQPIS